MRRALLTVTLGGVLLAGAACDSDPAPTAGAPSAGGGSVAPPGPSTVPSGPDFTEDTRKVCAELDKRLNKHLEAFGAELGKMIANKEADVSGGAKEAQAKAARELEKFSDDIREAGAKAQDPAVRAATEETANL